MSSFLKKQGIVIICLHIVCSNVLNAQTNQMSLQSMITDAQKYFSSIKQKQSYVAASNALEIDVKHSFLPQLKVSDQINIGTDNSIAGSYLPIGINISSSAGVRGNNIYEPATGNVGVLYGEYNLITFGLNQAQLSNARAYTNLSNADLQQELYNIEWQVAKLYFQLLRTQYHAAADKQNANRYDSIYKVIRALTLSGIKPGADSSLARAELSKAKIVYNQTTGRIAELKQQLSYYTGISPNLISIDTSANRYSELPASDQNFISDTINHPLLQYFERKKELTASYNNLIRHSFLPKIILATAGWARGSSIQYNDKFLSLSNGIGYQKFNYDIGVAFTYNLFNGLYKKDKLLINQYDLQADDFALQQQKQTLISAAMQADNSLQTTKTNLIELPVQLQSAKDTYLQKLAQYKAGIISLIDLTNASFVLYRSQTDYIETINDWYQASLDKAAATGNLEQFIQSVK